MSACGDGGGVGGGGGPNPVAVDACIVTGAGQPLQGALPGSGSGATYAHGDKVRPSKGTVDIDIAGNFRYTPRTDLPSGRARGMDAFSYRLTDRTGRTTEATVTVLIDGKVRIMPLGDSITTGRASNNTLPESQQVSYRRKLYNDLDGLDTRYGIDFIGRRNTEGGAANPPLPDLDHEGHPGWCDDNNPFCAVSDGQTIDRNITAILDTNPPDLILLHIGTNHFDSSAGGVDSILDKINAWAERNYPLTVFVARIIPTRDGSLPVDTFNNNVADNVAVNAPNRPSAQIFMVDHQSAFRLAGDPDPDKADPVFMSDNLHPSQAGYERMADRWRDDLIASGVLPDCQ